MTREILVVDDQPGIRLLLQEVFTNEGYHVTTVTTGKEALDRLFSKKFDLIMLDYKLPVVDGIEVLREMKDGDISTPAIIMSGLPEDISTEAEQLSPVKKVLAKPFNVQEVCDYTKSLLG
ncbi:sporulation initiation phosphotransferase Spo0F [Virgibacillus siamensis]|uniref:Sporulation initiation phosphotransferase Spo0F n=1 Tax=Virgibacillus siamensis TaxID=480071 RepID=A0ABN1G7I0_9BACI